ncbi:MAG: hypothetical protein C0467_26200 [Planctomycetaceae bacterium]|nr:hypothetical protein [Planctomycetaceae bacterium]
MGSIHGEVISLSPDEDTEFEPGDGRMWSMVDYALTYVHACIAALEVFDPGTEVAVRLEQRLVFNEAMSMFGTADFMATGTRKGKGAASSAT